jgi:hypothetical protein
MEVFEGVKIETLKNDAWTNEVTCVLTLLKNSGNGGSVVIQGHDEEGELRFKTSVIHLTRSRYHSNNHCQVRRRIRKLPPEVHDSRGQCQVHDKVPGTIGLVSVSGVGYTMWLLTILCHIQKMIYCNAL